MNGEGGGDYPEPVAVAPGAGRHRPLCARRGPGSVSPSAAGYNFNDTRCSADPDPVARAKEVPVVGRKTINDSAQFGHSSGVTFSTVILDLGTHPIYKDSGLNTPPVRAGMKALFVPKAQEL